MGRKMVFVDTETGDLFDLEFDEAGKLIKWEPRDRTPPFVSNGTHDNNDNSDNSDCTETIPKGD